MIPILYKTITEGTVPTNYGIGPLTDCLSCEVTEERNGAYELALTYPANGIHAEDIEYNAVIMAKPNFMDEPQLFRINKVGGTIAGKFTVQAYHISYDLSGKIIKGGSAASCGGACALLTASAGAFSITTDKTTAKAFKITEPSSVRSWLGGKDGSLLDIYKGEWAYNNFGASLKTARGADRGVTIRYGKNLTQLSQVIDMSNLCTAIIPYYIDQNGNKTIGTKVSTGLTITPAREKAIDFSQDVEPESAVPIATQLATLAAAYISSNNLTAVTKSITLDFIQDGNIKDRVDLCDTVTIYYEALGISGKAKCVKTTWDVLGDRYTKATFGSLRPNIADTIASNSKELEETPTRSEVSRATELITGNRGGYVIFHDSDGDSLPDEILIMNTPDITTATKVWRWNKSGLGYSSTGYAGPYGLAMTAEGEIDADFIKVGIITDQNGKFSLDMTSGAAYMSDFKAIESFSLYTDTNIKKAEIVHNSGTGTNFNLLNEASNVVFIADSRAEGGYLFLQNNADVAVIEAGVSSDSGYLFIKNSSGRVTIQAIGADGGLAFFNTSGTNTITESGSSGNITCVSLTQTSSRKVKKNIKTMSAEDAKAILQLEAVRFDFKNEEQGRDKSGFIAEDVADIIPSLVTPETEDRPAALDYIGIIPYLQAVIKEQDRRITELEKKIKDITGG